MEYKPTIKKNPKAPKLTKPLKPTNGFEAFSLDTYIKRHKDKNFDIIYINSDYVLFAIYSYYILMNMNTKEKQKMKIFSPIVSPDRKHLTYLKKEKKRIKLILFNIETKFEIELLDEKITKLDHRNENFYDNKTFSPIKYIWTQDPNKMILDITENNKNSTYKNDKVNIYIIDLNTTEKKLFTTLEIGQVHFLNVVKDTLFLTDVGYYCNRSTIYSLNMNTNELLKIKQFDFVQQFLDPQLSLDNKKMGVICDFESNDFGYIYDLGIFTLENRKLERITKNIKWGKIKWIGPNELVGIRIYGPYSQLYKIDLTKKKIKQITREKFRITVFDIYNYKIIYVGHDIYGGVYIKILDLATGTKRKIKYNALVKNIKFGKVSEVNWNGTFDNMRGLLLYPVNYDPNKKYGLIVDIHGGGSVGNMKLNGSIFRGREPSEWFLWTQKDLFVFAPEFRSSGIYNQKALLIDDQKNKDIFNCDIQDIESGVDYLIENEQIDQNKMMVIGGSSGAMRANWLPVVSKRYKTIISVDGAIDERLFKYSPLQFLDKIETPILFIMGNPEFGGIDKENTVKKYYDELTKKGIFTEYMFIDDEGHNFYKKDNMKNILGKVFEWIDKYIL